MTTRPKALGRTRYWGKQIPPKDKGEIFNVVTSPNATDGSETATIRVYGPIDSWGGWWGVSAEEMSATLDALGPQINQIILRLNSPGGEVFEGLTILNMLRAHKATVTAVVDGLAASAASVIAVGCDRTVMSPGTQLMIHDTRVAMYGTASDLRKEADVLDSITGSLIEIYAGKAGDADWKSILESETWYSAAEALTAKLVDAVEVVPDAGATATPAEPTEDVASYEDDDFEANHPRRYGAHTPPVASANGSNNAQKETASMFSSEQIAQMRQELGLPETADAATIVAAQSEALAERAETPAATTVIPEGTSLVSTEVLDALRTQAAQGAEARAQQLDERRDNTLDAAVRSGRIAPAQRENFTTLWKADPAGTEALINQLAPGLVPVAELGHDTPAAGETSAVVDDSALDAFASTFGISKEDLR